MGAGIISRPPAHTHITMTSIIPTSYTRATHPPQNHLLPHTHLVHYMIHHPTPPLLPISRCLITHPGCLTRCGEACQVIKICHRTHHTGQLAGKHRSVPSKIVQATSTQKKYIHHTYRAISTSASKYCPWNTHDHHQDTPPYTPHDIHTTQTYPRSI